MKFTLDKRVAALIVIAVFALSLVPLLIISFYNFPNADDFSYGKTTVHAWRESGSVFSVLKAACIEVAKYYDGWQGTFTAVFLFTLVPSVFGEGAYFLTTFFLIGVLVFGTVFISKTLLMDYLKADKWQWLLITLLPLGTSIQLLPSAFQGFFWWNGAVFYTFFYSLSLVYFALVLKLLKSERRRIAHIIAIFIIAFLLGGGSYPVALVTCEISFLISAVALYKRRKGAVIAAAGLVFTLAGLAISAVAPGNAIRQTAFDGLPPLNAILISFERMGNYMSKWLTAPLVLCILLTTPLIFGVISKLDFKFRFPPLVTIITFCVLSSFWTPSLYAMGEDVIPARYTNIVYYAFYWFLLINLFYYAGWLSKKFPDLISGIGGKLSKNAAPVLCVAVLATLFLSHNQIYRFTSVSALQSLISGEAKAYSEEQHERFALYNDPDVSVVEVRDITAKPYVLYEKSFHVTESADDWRNIATARYYDKERVVLIP